MEDKNNRNIRFIVAVAVLLTFSVGASFAYFQARLGAASSTSIEINTGTVDNLSFNSGSAISLNLTPENFTSAKQSATTEPYVVLKARNDRASTYNYNAYLNITENTFVNSSVSATSDGRLTTNLLVYPYKDTSKTIKHGENNTNTGDIIWQLSDNFNDQSIRVWGSSATSTFILEDNLTLSAGTYYTVKTPDASTVIYGITSDGTEKTLATSTISSFTLTESTTFTEVGVRITNQGSFDYTIYPYISKTDSQYEPYGHIENATLYVNVYKNNTIIYSGDISNKTGKIYIPLSPTDQSITHSISATAGSTNTVEWKVYVEFNNGNGNQLLNASRKFEATFDFERK